MSQPEILTDVGNLYSERYDFPEFKAPPGIRYLIATTQRSGSNLLALALWRTGGFGAPLEYIRAPTVSVLRKRFQTSGHVDYWRALETKRTSTNGVFGFKAFASHVKECARSMPELFDVCLGIDRFVYLTREDKEAQAISLARASQTDVWVLTAGGNAKGAYDRALIAGCRRFIERQEAAWMRHFERVKSTPVIITYESLANDSTLTARRVAEALGVDLEGCRGLELPTLVRQSDAQSEEWLRRFKASEGR
jgi:trehalose 2-sulfotransferase